MAISRISTTVNSGATATLGSHQAGDLIVVTSHRINGTPASNASGFTSVVATGLGFSSVRISYKWAASGAESAGTWTNSNVTITTVYRGVTEVGASAITTASSATVSYPAVTQENGNGQSWMLRAMTHSTSTNATTNAPSGYTLVNGDPNGAALWDSNGGTSSSGVVTQSVNGANNYTAATLELRSDVGVPDDPFYLLNGTAVLTDPSIVLFDGSQTTLNDHNDFFSESVISLAADRAGNLYVGNLSTSGSIKKKTPAGVITTVPFTSAITLPQGLVVDNSNNIYAQSWNGAGTEQIVLKLTSGGIESTAPFASPLATGGNTDLACDSAGNLYASNEDGDWVKKLTTAGVESTLGFTTLNTPQRVAVGSDGTVYVANAGTFGANNGTISVLTSGGSESTITPPMPGTVEAVAVGASGNVYGAVHNSTGGNRRCLFQRTPGGTVTVLKIWPRLFNLSEIVMVPPPGTPVKAYVGGVWTEGVVKRHDGSNWIAASLKRHDGSNWV